MLILGARGVFERPSAGEITANPVGGLEEGSGHTVRDNDPDVSAGSVAAEHAIRVPPTGSIHLAVPCDHEPQPQKSIQVDQRVTADWHDGLGI